MKKTRFTIFLLILFVTSNNHPLNAQHKNDFEARLFNIGFGGIVGGFGAVINKKPNEKTGKIFLKGFYQGALGGYLLFESKRLVGKFGKTGNYNYVWPSKLVNFAGVSIIENAAGNRNFWERWHINFGFNRLEFHTKDKFKLSYRIMPFSFGNTIYGFTQGKLDINTSLKIGSFVFATDKINNSKGFEGVTFANTILYQSDNTILNKIDIISHEIIHVYQYESFSGFNPFLDKPISKFIINDNWTEKYVKIFYTDFNYLVKGILIIAQEYENSFFEKEARYYTE